MTNLISTFENATDSTRNPEFAALGDALAAALRDRPAGLATLVAWVGECRGVQALERVAECVYRLRALPQYPPPSTWRRVILEYLRTLEATPAKSGRPRYAFEGDGEVFVLNGTRYPFPNDQSRRLVEALATARKPIPAIRLVNVRAAEAYKSLPEPIRRVIRRPKPGGREGYFLDADPA